MERASRPRGRIFSALAGLLCLFAGLWIARLSAGATLRLAFAIAVIALGLDAVLGALRGRQSHLLRQPARALQRHRTHSKTPTP